MNYLKLIYKNVIIMVISNGLTNELNELKVENKLLKEKLSKFGYEPGHFSSPIPDVDLIESDPNSLYRNKEYYGIDIHEEEQINLMNEMFPYFEEYNLNDEKIRYHYPNNYFPPSDALTLHAMLRMIKPSRLIEVGSGFSSAVTLDTNEFYFNNSMELTFIEPYPDRLKSLLRPKDYGNVEIIESNLQNVSLDFFKKLNENDILFIDSSHVTKADSDVNYLIHSILPNLNKGVYIHFHDIHNRFEYPLQWIEQGKCWNESYILRAFLEFNDYFEIILFYGYLREEHPDKLRFPDYVIGNAGASFWIKKIK